MYIDCRKHDAANRRPWKTRHSGGITRRLLENVCACGGHQREWSVAGITRPGPSILSFFREVSRVVNTTFAFLITSSLLEGPLPAETHMLFVLVILNLG